MVADICRLFGPLADKAKKPVYVLEPKTVAETASTLLDLDTSHTKFNSKKDGARFVEDSAQVSKFSKGKDLGLTKVVGGSKQVIGYAVAVVMGKVVKPQLQRNLKKLMAKRTLV
jgi:hypothetical protein